MIRHTAARTWSFWKHRSGLGLLFLLLAVVLMACGSGSPGGTGSFPKGKLHVWDVPNASTLPGQIVRGPDGNVWFPAIAYEHFTTNQPSGALGRLAPNGQFHLFPLPAANSYPTAMTFASDGSIWFIAFQGNGELAPNVDSAPRFTDGFSELGHMTPDGQFHFFLLPAADISSTSIAAGPDGNLWFTENIDDTDATSQRIGRMTPAGAFTEFAVAAPFGHSYLRQIIAGPDGNLWFSLEGSDASYNALGAIGKITPQGAITIIPLGTYDTPEDMTVGPDHTIWFTTNFEVGRVTPDGHARCLTLIPTRSKGIILDWGASPAGRMARSGLPRRMWRLGG